MEYFDFAHIFSPEFTAKLSGHIKMNDVDVNFIDGKQLFYGLLYSLKPIKLETLMMYIKTNLANGFIKTCQSLIDAWFLLFESLMAISTCLLINKVRMIV